MVKRLNYPGKKEYLRLKANMLNEHILSGLAIDEVSFYKNDVYAECSHDGKLAYHIYPVVTKMNPNKYMK